MEASGEQPGAGAQIPGATGTTARPVEPEQNGHHDEEPQEVKPKPPTILDRLRRQYAEADDERRLTLPVLPGRFDGALQARYQPVDWDEVRKRARRYARRGGSGRETELNYAASVIAQACEMILIRPAEGAEHVPVHEYVPEFRGAGPVGFDPRLCSMLGIIDPPPNAPSIVRLVFKNEGALIEHYQDVESFLTEQTPGDEEDDEEGGDRPT